MQFNTSNRLRLAAGIAFVFSAGVTASVNAAELRYAVPEGTVIIPEASQPAAEAPGLQAHANVRIFQPAGKTSPAASQPSGRYETPASLACLYGLTPKVTGCNPETLTKVTTGGSKVLAIVDAYDYPNAESDLAVFSKQYGLPAVTNSNFVVAYAGGKKPTVDSTGGWELEEALDVQMAHALAPGAKVILVEAQSPSYADLLAAEKVAAQMVSAAGGGEVSNSWIASESANEEGKEKDFKTKGVVYFASAGDSPGIGQPAALSNVVAVGGTSINRDSKGNFVSEVTWSSGGGGSSAYVPVPAYQKPVASIVGKFRGTPDISLDANPSTGVWIYDTNPYKGSVLDWLVIGGTSVSSPALAAIINNAGNFFGSTVSELTKVYKGFTKPANFTDITAGTCGSNNKTTKAVKGWDFCTGVGTPLGSVGK